MKPRDGRVEKLSLLFMGCGGTENYNNTPSLFQDQQFIETLIFHDMLYCVRRVIMES